jgi:very-short-patch-repair endonuclease
MKIADALVNKSEEIVLRELEAIAGDNGLRVFAKPRLSDVIVKGKTRLSAREFDFYTRAHVDFAVADETSKPIMVVEYDGRYHTQSQQVERDKIKDSLCVDAGLRILRINANHVTRLYRGISVLRWIVEVTELQKWFERAQADGQIPYDEPFDPAMIADDGRGRKWPYWLSVIENQSMLSFLQKLGQDTPKGRTGILGSDESGN